MGKSVSPQSPSSPQWARPGHLVQPPPPPQPGLPWHPDPPRPGPTWRPDPPRPPHPGPTWRPDPPHPGPTWRPDPPRPPWPPHPGPTQSWPKELTLTVVKTAVPPFRPRVVRLRCDPPYGSHPRAAEACSVLNRAQGDPDRIRARQEFCRRDYDPVKATATGVWNRRPIRYERTFSNSCVMRNETGVVFSF
ncbi:SSI family serine proteinase inhibitor [Streptosporangium subroseum]|uniref:SSI family serine proteinase inhibitor n=1 Tax=Streptosporangium subroseum TaxID=106412 RepID=UPI003416E3AB